MEDNKEFWMDRVSRETYNPPFTYNKKNHYIVNSKNEAVAFIALGHAMKSLNKDRNAFGELIVKLLNEQNGNSI